MNFILLFIPPLLLGIVFLRFGLRGRRVDDHPVCRKCGFDLFGRPEASERCAECGADLTRPRAIQDGRRERRRGLVAMGALLLAVALTVAGGVGYATFAAADSQKLKPTWWLVREIDSGDVAVAAAAAKELSVRVTRGTLSQRYIDATADKLLAIQTNPQAKWDAAFGDFLEDARSAGKLSDQRFHTYAIQAPGFELAVRPRINRGDGLPFSIREGHARVGSRRSITVKFSTNYRIDTMDLGDVGSIGSEDTLSQHSGGSVGSTIDLRKLFDKLPDGPHTAAVVMNMSFHMTNAPPGSPPMFWTKHVISAPFDLWPQDAPTVTVVRDDTLHSSIDQAIAIENVRHATWNKDAVDFRITVKSVPVDLGLDVFVVTADGKQRKATSVAVESKLNSSSSLAVNVMLPNFDGDKLDFILRSSVAAAKGSIDVFSIWEGEVVKRDVPVKPRPTTRVSPVAPTTSPASTQSSP